MLCVRLLYGRYAPELIPHTPTSELGHVFRTNDIMSNNSMENGRMLNSLTDFRFSAWHYSNNFPLDIKYLLGDCSLSPADMIEWKEETGIHFRYLIFSYFYKCRTSYINKVLLLWTILIDLIPFKSFGVNFQSPSHFHLNSKILSLRCLCYKGDILFIFPSIRYKGTNLHWRMHYLPNTSNTKVQARTEKCIQSSNKWNLFSADKYHYLKTHM